MPVKHWFQSMSTSEAWVRGLQTPIPDQGIGAVTPTGGSTPGKVRAPAALLLPRQSWTAQGASRDASRYYLTNLPKHRLLKPSNSAEHTFPCLMVDWKSIEVARQIGTVNMLRGNPTQSDRMS